MNRRSLLLGVISVAAAASVAAFALRGRGHELAVLPASLGPAIEAVYATGTVEPVVMAEIRPKNTSRIAAWAADEGDRVTQGQPLARLDEAEARAKLDELTARAAYWRGELERQQTLAERGVASREALARAQSEARAADASVAAARQRLGDELLTAPFDGLVMRRDGEIGEVVDNKRTLFWIGQAKPLRITAEVDEEDIPRIQRGQTVLVKSDAFPGQAFEGRVEQVTPKGDPLTKTFRVRLGLPDDAPLLPGMTTELNIVVQKVERALLVPATAVAEGRVFVVEDGVAHHKPVRVGIVGRKQVQVVDGLAEGAMVVAEPPKGLSNGDRVRPLPAPRG